MDAIRFDIQLDTLHSSLKENGKNMDIHDILEYIKSLSQSDKSLLCEVVTLATLILVIPATNALSERSFSQLRRIKSYLRSTMTQVRLNHCIILNTYVEELDGINLIDIAKDFVGLPIATNKVEGPTTVLEFLGIEFDTQSMSMRLPPPPPEKLGLVKDLLKQWLERKAATKRATLSLIGELVHASKVVIPGRTFLRRMLDTAHSRPRLDHWIRLDHHFRSDLMWWHTFIDQWNGVSILSSHVYRPPRLHTFNIS